MRAPQFQEQIAHYKRAENLALIAAWAPPGTRSVLKTDLFEEAFGEDRLLDVLADRYPRVTGLEISPVVAAAARRRLPALPCVVGDVAAVPLRAGSVDLIVSISTLDHLPPPLLPAALADLCRVLRPGGCLILTLDSRHNPLHVLSNVLRRRLGRIHAERCYTVGEVRAALAGLGVLVTAVTAIYHVPFPVNFLARQAERLLGRGVRPPVRLLTRWCARLGGLPTRFLTGRYIALRIVRPAAPTAGADGAASRQAPGASPDGRGGHVRAR
jgi:SAM-dependent methyltransferase